MNRDPLKFFIKKGDLDPPIRRTFIDGNTGLPKDFTGHTVHFVMNNPDHTAKFKEPAVIENPPTSGVLLYYWKGSETYIALDTYPCEFHGVDQAGKPYTLPKNEEEPGKSHIFVTIGRKLAV